LSKKATPAKVVISATELEKLELHAYSNLTAEVGGMLVGSVKGGVTNIVGSIPALSAAAEQVSLTFTHEVWDDILKTAARDFPGTVIVGWYHTHPSFGLFLSQYDSFIQDNFFKEPGQVALVIDPIAGSQAWFAHDKNKSIVKFDETNTVTGPTTRPDFTPKAQRSNMKFAIAVITAIVLTSALTWSVAKLSSPSNSTQALLEARDINTALQLQAGALQNQLGQVLAQPVLYYTVREGDTLDSISRGFYGNTDAVPLLLEINGIEATATLAVGQIIMLAYIPGVTIADQPAGVAAPTFAPTPSPSATPTTSPTTTPQATPTPSPAPSGDASSASLTP
jgi:proteasome lid subunit RPN8/RPN11/LysM repeat protein